MPENLCPYVDTESFNSPSTKEQGVAIGGCD